MIVAVSTVSAGNAADTVARIVLDQVLKQIGQSFVIENRTGAGGTIGSASAAKAGRAVRLAAERASRRTVERLDIRHQLVVAAKANPGALNFASAGFGSASHWVGERLRLDH